MNNKRINVHYINAELNTIWDKTKEKDFPPMNRHMVYGMLVDKLIAELKRCYERLDKADEVMLKAREVLMKHHEWMSVNDATSEEDDQEILDVVKDLREASE